jgi:hypothetical protein
MTKIKKEEKLHHLKKTIRSKLKRVERNRFNKKQSLLLRIRSTKRLLTLKKLFLGIELKFLLLLLPKN